MDKEEEEREEKEEKQEKKEVEEEGGWKERATAAAGFLGTMEHCAE